MHPRVRRGGLSTARHTRGRHGVGAAGVWDDSPSLSPAVSPPIGDSLAFLGKDETIARIDAFLAQHPG